MKKGDKIEVDMGNDLPLLTTIENFIENGKLVGFIFMGFLTYVTIEKVKLVEDE